VVFDEIHKHRAWKVYLKGVFDRFHREFDFLVTGSGRPDAFRRGASLTGRYRLFHLWPFTLADLASGRRAIDDFWREPAEPCRGKDSQGVGVPGLATVPYSRPCPAGGPHMGPEATSSDAASSHS